MTTRTAPGLRANATRTLIRSLGIAAILQAAAVASASSMETLDHCTSTAEDARKSCLAAAKSDYFLATGVCENLPPDGNERDCTKDAHSTRKDATGECDAQRAARLALCTLIGEDAYSPAIDPANFSSTIDNPFLPWTPGTTLTYDNTNGEHVIVEVLSDTVPILNVDCRAVHDVGMLGGFVIEDTYDYYAQDTAGNVWYFGEDTAQYDHGRLIGLEGSWRAGEESASPGIAQEAVNTPGDVYRQEFKLGTAEDQATVVSTTSSATVPFGGTYNNCLETAETSALEPDTDEHKFYASGVGLVLTVDEVTGDREELTNVTP